MFLLTCYPLLYSKNFKINSSNLRKQVMKLNSIAKYSTVLPMTLLRNFLVYLYKTPERGRLQTPGPKHKGGSETRDWLRLMFCINT